MKIKKSYQKALNIAGPKIFTLLEIIKEIKNSLNKKNIIIPLNKKLTWFFVRMLELSPVKLVTRDNLKSMEIDNTAPINDSYQYKSSLRQLSSYLKKYSD